jgi:hypothetical protein
MERMSDVVASLESREAVTGEGQKVKSLGTHPSTKRYPN